VVYFNVNYIITALSEWGSAERGGEYFMAVKKKAAKKTAKKR
jgi:hypothetical protein